MMFFSPPSSSAFLSAAASVLFFLMMAVPAATQPATAPEAITLQNGQAPNEDFFAFRRIITPELLQEHLHVMASDSMMGRGTGEPGVEMAADYLVNELKSYGVAPAGDDGSYFQHFDLYGFRAETLSYELFDTSGGDSVRVWQQSVSEGDAGAFFTAFGGAAAIRGDIVFGGAAAESSADIQGKWVLVFEGTDAEIEAGEVPSLRDMLTSYVFRGGARGLLVIAPEYLADASAAQAFDTEALRRSQLIDKPSGIRLPDRGGQQGFSAAVKQISPDMAMRLLSIDSLAELRELRAGVKTGARNPADFPIEYALHYSTDRQEETIPAKNVLGVVEGCHETLKDEVIVMSAHYDHIGIGQPDENGDMINNGADDNGSGTVSTLSLAQTIQQAKDEGHCLDRSILFLFVSAEENGLLGSRYYSDNPVFPIEQTVANFNLDMFGRIDYEYEGSDEDYIYIIGAEIISSDLDRLLKQANRHTENLTLDMRYNDLDDRNQFYRRSDHWNFGRLGVPFIFFFSGLHDNYHTPSDEIELIPFDLLSSRARLIYSTLVEVANSNVRPVVDNQEFIDRTR
ncbi:MAG: M28 family peptidase [Cyclonatronaceae bacterium]